MENKLLYTGKTKNVYAQEKGCGKGLWKNLWRLWKSVSFQQLPWRIPTMGR